MTYALLGLIALVLLTGLVAFGVGHRRWSVGTLIAAILVLLAATGYLYLASRFAAYESKQVEAVGRKQIDLARVRDALAPDPSNGGRLKPIPGDGPESMSITALTEQQERWRRALDRVTSWSGRSWTKASFEPPKADGGTGTIRIPFVDAAAPPAEGADPAAPAAAPAAAAAAAPDTPPLDPGATVYVFENKPFKNGGRYLGAFRVDSSTPDKESKCFVLTVLQTAARDPIDAEMWASDYEHDAQDNESGVTVYESLPPDRWAASPTESIDTLSIDELEKMLDERDRQRPSLDQADQAESPSQAIAREEWTQIRERLDDGTELAGSYWAVVKFKEETTVAEAGDDAETPLTYEPETTAEFDLQTAFALADDGKAAIEEVYRRRTLSDPGTQIHGSSIFSRSGADEAILVDGAAALAAVLNREIRSLEASAERLEKSKADIADETKVTKERGRKLAEDKTSWNRDAEEATRMADSFAAALEKSRGQLAATEQAIIALGAELRTSVGRLVERIDAVAPAPDQPPAAVTP